MPEAALAPLAGWDSFYVIIGSSAAALTGLMFVVIALSGESQRGTTTTVASIRAFGTPTVVHFGAVLLLAAVVTTPGHSLATLTLCVSVCGFAGLGFTRWIVIQTRKQSDYVPGAADWMWHARLPALAYAGLLGAAGVLWWRLAPALVLVGGAALLLLYIGIHNAWDAAIWVSVGRREAEQRGHGGP